jgi:hypothetical protein
MVACDQPFDEVEKPEFIAVMGYSRHGKFTLPKRDGVRRRVMKLGDETVEQLKEMFAVKFSIINTCYELIFFKSLWKERSVFPSMRGRPVIVTLSWP